MKLHQVLIFCACIFYTQANNLLFTSSVFKEIASNTPDDNFVSSPLSAEIILALVQSGAKGASAEEVRSALKLPQNQQEIESKYRSILPQLKGDEYYTLSSANKIYVKSGFGLKDDFKKIATGVFQSDIESIDFIPDTVKASSDMNKWVEEKTGGKITDLIQAQDINELTRMFLINALYFKGNWTNPFNLESTRKQNFHKSSQNVIKDVDFMHETSYYGYHESQELNAKFLEMRFEGGPSFVIVLPNEKDGVKALENQAEKIFEPQDFKTEYVKLELPRFKIKKRIDFVNVLKKLGVKVIFDETKADFSGIAGEPGDIYVNKVLQEAVIDVNENGVEAAAATYVHLPVPTSIQVDPPKPKDFIVDHPFIFYIKINDLIVFTGKVVDPK